MSNSFQINNADDFIKNYSNHVHNKHLQVASPIPDICKDEPCILGVDEAGRGPVLGPMVYGICFCPLSKRNEFEALGCADSKALTDKRREEIFSILCACSEYVAWAVDIISPNFISNSMLRRTKHSLNQVAQDSTVGLIQAVLDLGVRVSHVYVDTVGPPEKYQERLSKFFPECQITVAKKADALYPIVSGASICAKVVRDRVISSWTFPEMIEISENNYGSGYPNDPGTKKFLSDSVDPVFGFPNLVRFSWSTVDKFLETQAYQVEWPVEEEEKGKIQKFFQNTPMKDVNHSVKHRFFTENGIKSSSF